VANLGDLAERHGRIRPEPGDGLGKVTVVLAGLGKFKLGLYPHELRLMPGPRFLFGSQRILGSCRFEFNQHPGLGRQFGQHIPFHAANH